MKRVHPLLLIAAVMALLVLGAVWKVLGADRCMDVGGTVVAPMKRFQHCVD